jgi:hypothetical protein
MLKLITERDIYRTATQMILCHGMDAEIEAARQADLVLKNGDRDQVLDWLRIKRTISELRVVPIGAH